MTADGRRRHARVVDRAGTTQLAMRFEVMARSDGSASSLIGLLGRELGGDRTGLIARGHRRGLPVPLGQRRPRSCRRRSGRRGRPSRSCSPTACFRQPTRGTALALGRRLRRRRAGTAPSSCCSRRSWGSRCSELLAQPWSRAPSAPILGRSRWGPSIAHRRTVGRLQPQPLRRADVPLDQRRHRDARRRTATTSSGAVDRSDVSQGLPPGAGTAGRPVVVSRGYRERTIDYGTSASNADRYPVVLLARIGRTGASSGRSTCSRGTRPKVGRVWVTGARPLRSTTRSRCSRSAASW